MQLTPEQCEAVRQVASGLVARGYSKEEAVQLACAAACRMAGRGAGMGQEPKLILNAEDGPNGVIAEVKATVSPWLWTFSLFSFFMALNNARKISKMFGDWRRRRMPA